MTTNEEVKTPRTDAFIDRMRREGWSPEMGSYPAFCKDLERELIAANERAEKAEKGAATSQEHAEQAEAMIIRSQLDLLNERTEREKANALARELEADKKRLDWLEQYLSDDANNLSQPTNADPTWQLGYNAGLSYHIDGHGDSLRAAIDAAIKERP